MMAAQPLTRLLCRHKRNSVVYTNFKGIYVILKWLRSTDEDFCDKLPPTKWRCWSWWMIPSCKTRHLWCTSRMAPCTTATTERTMKSEVAIACGLYGLFFSFGEYCTQGAAIYIKLYNGGTLALHYYATVNCILWHGLIESSKSHFNDVRFITSGGRQDQTGERRSNSQKNVGHLSQCIAREWNAGYVWKH